MVVYCCAYGCNNERTPTSNIRFHKFPLSRPEINNLWIKAVRRENFKPTKYTVICSEHFTPDSYMESSANRKLLKNDAVPSHFNFPSHLQPKAKPLRGIKRKYAPEASASTFETILNNNCDVDAPENRTTGNSVRNVGVQTCFRILKKSLPEMKMMTRKMKTLQQKVSRKDKKLKTMKDLIIHLKKNIKPNSTLEETLMNNFEESSSESYRDMGRNLCMVQKCYNHRLSCPNLAFFKLPKDPVRARRWVELAMREDLLQNDIFLKRDCRMCSAHFTDLQFRKKYPRILLNKDALPVNLIKVTPSKETSENYTDTNRTFTFNEEINGYITVPVKQETADKSPEETSEHYFGTNKIVMVKEEKNGYVTVPIKQEAIDESDNQLVVVPEETIDIIKIEMKEESTVPIKQETADTLDDQSFVQPKETFVNYIGSNTTMIKGKERNGFMTMALKKETDDELDDQPAQENQKMHTEKSIQNTHLVT